MRRSVPVLCVAAVVTLVGCGSTTVRTVIKTRTVTVTSTATRTAEAPQPIYVPETGGPPQYKPSAIYISGDAGDIWSIRRWITYGGDTAEAIATTSTNDCDPTCASGHETSATVRILFSSRIPCKGVPAYAGFEVMRSSNASVAPVGSERDLELLCRG